MASQDAQSTRAPTQWLAEIHAIETSLGDTPFLDVFKEDQTEAIVAEYVRDVVAQSQPESDPDKDRSSGRKSLVTANRGFRTQAIRLGLASLAAFLQGNVTGPVLEGTDTSDASFSSAYEEYISSRGIRTNGSLKRKSPIECFRSVCLRSLDTDGVSVYPYIPHIELFGLARFIFTSGGVLPTDPPEAWEADSDDTLASGLSWTRLRIHLWHYKLLTQPALGSGSLFTKSGRWTDVASLQVIIEKSISDAETAIIASSESAAGSENIARSHQIRIQFYLEKANAYLMLGNDKLANEALRSATESSGFLYALSGALGKRTKFQEKDVSQLVVLAKSLQVTEPDVAGQDSSEPAPAALPLNDDTLLENINFKEDAEAETSSTLPEQLRNLSPDNQPKLKLEDQIILLTEATLKDTFSPSDSLTSEEILPFAVRVINDKSQNWQVYTQALLVRSRIELHRSRTLERAVLQLQAVVDQVIVDTQTPMPTSKDASAAAAADPKLNANGNSADVPSIEITATNGHTTVPVMKASKPTTFFPAPKPNESASAQERLRYVHALASPPRWHLESELAFAWASVGSLVSATEIFKRLRLWAEVALCLASNANSADDDQDGLGRGSGGEEKARAIVRWRLYHRTGRGSNIASANGDQTNDDNDDDDGDDLDNADIDLSSLKASDFQGPERHPAPPNAPRLFCILGDLESNTDATAGAHYYERAWEISGARYARAQRSLGELHLRNKAWEKARAAYAAAVAANRLSPEMWGRLGDIELRLGRFPDAAEAFQRSIATTSSSVEAGVESGSVGGEDARTWSNLGSALLSWYREVVAETKDKKAEGGVPNGEEDVEEDEDSSTTRLKIAVDEETMPSTARAARLGKRPQGLLQDALEAFKRGAAIAHSNWRIWDNVVTLAASLRPAPALDDVVLATRHVLRIRATEDALDLDILTLLVREVTGKPAGGEGSGGGGGGIYDPPRATLERRVVDLFEDDVVALLTARSEPWSLVSRLRAWRRDWAGALDAAEKGWRAAVGGAGAGVTGGGGGGGGGGGSSSTLTTTTTTTTPNNGTDWIQDAGAVDAWDAVVQRTSELVAAYENYGDRLEAGQSATPRWRGKARMAVRSVMSKGRETWEGSEGWGVLEGLLEGLKA
ncbi:hypothetical protein SLS62_010256 [Diatrype stigma]|uniref:TPR repeat-containing protein n=1 Tax=Diatrype stigma TaxID=117547 RepID=A0AAN9UB32_9PEZI